MTAGEKVTNGTPSMYGSIATPSAVSAVLTKLAGQNDEDLDWRRSIVDRLKLLDIDSSLAARKQLAEQLHYTGNMSDIASIDMWLHKRVMRKLAENGGRVLVDLMAHASSNNRSQKSGSSTRSRLRPSGSAPSRRRTKRPRSKQRRRNLRQTLHACTRCGNDAAQGRNHPIPPSARMATPHRAPSRDGSWSHEQRNRARLCGHHVGGVADVLPAQRRC